MVGRFVRVIPGRPPTDRSWLYIPADPRLRQHATDVEGDLRHILIPQEEGDGSELDEPEERRRGEPGEKRDFKPVLADVQAQMDLFAGLDGGGGSDGAKTEATDAHAGFMGKASAAAERAGEAAEAAATPPQGIQRDDQGRVIRPSQLLAQQAAAAAAGGEASAAGGSAAAEAAPVDPLDPWAALDDDEDEDEDTTPARSWQRAKPKRKSNEPAPTGNKPAWEHQEQLRRRRHTLVSELARATKVSQAQVNAEINAKLKIPKVEHASNEQLEQSIAMLLDLLSKRR